MIDQEVVREASNLLGVAIASIIEDVHPETMLAYLAKPDPERATQYVAMGEDLTALAAAILVLQRRSATGGEGSVDG